MTLTFSMIVCADESASPEQNVTNSEDAGPCPPEKADEGNRVIEGSMPYVAPAADGAPASEAGQN